MMTRQQFTNKIDEFFEGRIASKNIPEAVREECQRLVKTGAVDLEEAEDNYRIPKIVLVVAMENVAAQYKPPTKSDKEALSNLRNF